MPVFSSLSNCQDLGYCFAFYFACIYIISFRVSVIGWKLIATERTNGGESYTHTVQGFVVAQLEM